MLKNCLVCNKEFTTYPSKIALGKGKYCSKTCCLSVTVANLSSNTQFQKGESHPWQKHESITWSGYREIYSPEHPNKTKRGYVKEHRLVVEQAIGRFLSTDEQVHHINGDKLDNRIENLQIMSHQEHLKMHGSLIAKRWANYREGVLLCHHKG